MCRNLQGLVVWLVKCMESTSLFPLGTFSCRQEYKGGGVCIYISQFLQCSIINLEKLSQRKRPGNLCFKIKCANE